MHDDTAPYHLESHLVHGDPAGLGGHRGHPYDHHIVPPISASTAYRLGSAARGAAGFEAFANPEADPTAAPIYVYDRLDEPGRSQLEAGLATAEGGEACVTFATGMAAIAAALGVLLETGDTVVCHRTIYGCTYALLTRWFPRLGIEVVFVDLTDPAALGAVLAARPGVRVVYGETPCNPTLELLDLEAIAAAVADANRRRPGARRIHTVVDNTFATPICQRPLAHGIDLVVHSLTKGIGGFGTDMGGAVVGPARLAPDLLGYRKDFGGALAPKAAWPTLVYGLPTLALRLRRQMATALRVATFLAAHPGVDAVRYPGLARFPQAALARRQMRDVDGNFAPGTVITFRLPGPPEVARRAGRRLIDHLAHHAFTITLAVSLGQVRTLVEHPASMTHAPLPAAHQRAVGVEPGGLRLSIGIEHPEDLIADLARALEATAAAAARVPVDAMRAPSPEGIDEKG